MCWLLSGGQPLRLDNEDYKPYKGVRTITQHGIFQIRT